MKINAFFIFTTSVLFLIFFAFKPLEMKKQVNNDISMFTLSMFTMYELNDKGLSTQMSGTQGAKYKDKYVVENIDYTDNSKEFISNIKALSGTYKNDTVFLNGDVVYFREDGLTFETQSSLYNKKTSISTTDGPYVLYKGSNKAIGEKLKYNSLLNTVHSKNVTANYKFEER